MSPNWSTYPPALYWLPNEKWTSNKNVIYLSRAWNRHQLSEKPGEYRKTSKIRITPERRKTKKKIHDIKTRQNNIRLLNATQHITFIKIVAHSPWILKEYNKLCVNVECLNCDWPHNIYRLYMRSHALHTQNKRTKQQSFQRVISVWTKKKKTIAKQKRKVEFLIRFELVECAVGKSK